MFTIFTTMTALKDWMHIIHVLNKLVNFVDSEKELIVMVNLQQWLIVVYG